MLRNDAGRVGRAVCGTIEERRESRVRRDVEAFARGCLVVSSSCVIPRALACVACDVPMSQQIHIHTLAHNPRAHPRGLNRMADEVDEFDFDCDPLDTLPANALNELERDALLSTQHHRTASKHERATAGVGRPLSDYGFDDDDDDIINLDEQPPEVQRAYNNWSQHQRIVDLVPTGPAQETSHVGEAEGHPRTSTAELQARVLQVSPTRHHHTPCDAYTHFLSSWKTSVPVSSAWPKRQSLRQS